MSSKTSTNFNSCDISEGKESVTIDATCLKLVTTSGERVVIKIPMNAEADDE